MENGERIDPHIILHLAISLQPSTLLIHGPETVVCSFGSFIK